MNHERYEAFDHLKTPITCFHLFPNMRFTHARALLQEFIRPQYSGVASPLAITSPHRLQTPSSRHSPASKHTYIKMCICVTA
ncbi:hypothetical protein HBI42_017240 [Parastagonospora nodorum]|nr:hypothetical protein HBI43_017620 [Parastagonospora nodorum]KAH6272870.1 hypothetical protein HBI42_017240 [Parastagonospora nodorum]